MRNRTLKRYYCYHSCTVMKCRGIERESAEDIIEACTKKEAREIFKKRNNMLGCKECAEIVESEEELPYMEALEKYRRW